MKSIKVNLDKRAVATHEIHIGRNILDRIGLILSRNNWADRYFVITDDNVSGLHGKKFMNALISAGIKTDSIVLPPGEKSKSIETILQIARQLLEKGADRKSGLIAFGGGVVGDVTGFAASLYMRGIPLIQVPTTLMAQVDSALGGKTGINLPEGKNLLGSFTQPKAIFIDTALLQTLPQREFNNGLAEIIKYGIIEDPQLLAELEKNDLLAEQGEVLEKIIARCCGIKKAIIEIDDMEKGLRRILNFGHTIGHAVEASSGYSVSHGEAVSMGMAAAALISEKLGYLSSLERERIVALEGREGLPTRIPESLSTDTIISHLQNDKKKQDGAVRFVLLKKCGMPFMNGAVPESLIRDVVDQLKKTG